MPSFGIPVHCGLVHRSSPQVNRTFKYPFILKPSEDSLLRFLKFILIYRKLVIDYHVVLFVSGQIRLKDVSPDGSSGYVEMFHPSQNKWMNGKQRD